MAKYYSFDGTYSARLYTPVLDLTGQTSPTLRFWMYHYQDSIVSSNDLQVQISTDGGVNYTSLITISRYSNPSQWQRHIIDLSGYAGQSNVRLGFLGTTQRGEEFIDDVYVGPLVPDYNTSSMRTTPIGVIDSGQPITFTTLIYNSGDVSGTATTFHDSIPAGTTYVPGSASVQGGGTLTATVTSIDWSGIVTINQSITITFRVTPTALAGFITNTATISDPLAVGTVTKTASFPIRAVSDTWSMQGYNARRTSQTGAPGPLVPNLRWTYDFGARLQDNASPVIGSDGTIYQPTQGLFYAINPNGTLKWTANVLGSSGMKNAPALSPDGSTVYVLKNDVLPKVVALNTLNGGLLWEYAIENVTYSSFAVDGNGTIYIGTWKPAMYALNPNGTLKWRYDSPSSCGIEAPPAVDSNGYVYFIHNCIGLVALDSNGNFRWSDSRVGTSYAWVVPTIGPDGTIYVDRYAFNSDGTLKWQRTDLTANNYLHGQAISADGTTIFTKQPGGKIYALDSASGSTKWISTIADATEYFGGSPPR